MPSIVRRNRHMVHPIGRGCGQPTGTALVITMVLFATLSLAPPVRAVPDERDPQATFRIELEARRSNTSSCQPLRYNAVIEQVAAVVGKSTADYLSHNATHVPIGDPAPGLRNLGVVFGKSKMLQGADKDYHLAITGALLEGFAALPDCSYTEFGLDLRQDETTGYYLAVAVLTGL